MPHFWPILPDLGASLTRASFSEAYATRRNSTGMIILHREREHHVRPFGEAPQGQQRIRELLLGSFPQRALVIPTGLRSLSKFVSPVPARLECAGLDWDQDKEVRCDGLLPQWSEALRC